MNKKFFIPALIAAVFAAGAPALAQDRGQYGERSRDANWQQQDAHRGDDSRRGEYRRDERDGRRDGGWRDGDRRGDYQRGEHGRGDYRRGDGRRHYYVRDDGRRYRGAGPNHDLRRGERLPSRFHQRHYVVDNWRSHRLSAPPRGYHWVQTGDDYVLAAIATGLITQIILSN
ncbi:MAG TPA: RcnB family protein [Telluria sp.]